MYKMTLLENVPGIQLSTVTSQVNGQEYIQQEQERNNQRQN